MWMQHDFKEVFHWLIDGSEHSEVGMAFSSVHSIWYIVGSSGSQQQTNQTAY